MLWLYYHKLILRVLKELVINKIFTKNKINKIKELN